MTSRPSFFKPQQEKTVTHTTHTPSNICIDGRADFAVAIFLIDYLLTSTHQKNKHLADVLLKPLLKKLQETTPHGKPSIGYLTPIKYLQQLCLETNPNRLVPAFADVLNQLTLNYLLKNSREYTSAFLGTSPHTLSEEQLENNPLCLNPWMPSVISRLLELPFHISETAESKTLQKKHPYPHLKSPASTGIKLHWHGEQCFVSAEIQVKVHFETLDQHLFSPRNPFLSTNTSQHIQYVSQEASRSSEAYNTTKKQLTKYFETEKTSTPAVLKIYLNHLNQNKHLEQPSSYFDTTYGTQTLLNHAAPKNYTAFTPSRSTSDNRLREKLIETLARLLTLGEQLDMAATHHEKNEYSYAPSTN